MSLFQQQIWTPEGLQRLLILAAICAVWCIVAGRFRWFVPLSLAGAAVYTCAVTRDLALPAVLFFLLSATALGLRLLGNDANLLPALLAGVSAYVWLLSCTAFLPVHYWWTYTVMLALPLIGAAPLWPRLRIGIPKPRAWAVGVTGFVFLAHYLIALKPEVSSDGLSVHLALTSYMAQHHCWPFDIRNVTWAAMPMGGDWGYVVAYMLGGETAARLLNFAMLAVVAGLLYRTIRRWLDPSLSLLLVALFVSSPIVQLETGSLFIENFWAALLLGATITLVRFYESGDRRDALFAAALLGTALATKFGTFAFVLPAGILLALGIRRNPAKTPPLRTTGLAALFLILALPPYAAAYFTSGNPFFPVLNTVFKSPYYDTKVPLENVHYKLGLHWNTLYDATFHTSKYLESHDGGWGFQYLFLIPLAILLYRRTWPLAARAALPIALGFSVLTFSAQSYLRYIYPALPLFTIAAAAALAVLRDRVRMLYVAALAVSLAALILNVYFLPASGWYHSAFYLNPFDPTARTRYLDLSAPVRHLVDYLNQTHPGEPAAFVRCEQIAGLRGEAYTDTWHHYLFWRALWGAKSPEDCLRLAREKGIKSFVVPVREETLPELQMRAFLARYTDPEYRHGPYQIVRVLDHPDPARPRPPLPAGSHEDTSRGIVYSGAWIYDISFPQATAGTVTYSNQPGAVFRSSFSGSRITYVYTRAFNRGMAEVAIDGIVRATLDLYAPAIVWQSSATYEGLPAGVHTLTVRVLGGKNAASEDCFVDLDQLIVEEN